MGESALYQGALSLKLCKDNAISGLDLAFGYEAVARAYAVLGNANLRDKNKAAALAACVNIDKEEDRKYALSEINVID